jgi:inhibitor of KinA
MTINAPFPRFRAVSDRAVLVEFGDTFSDWSHAQVLSLHAKLEQKPFSGFTEAVPALVNILVCFDAIKVDHREAEAAIKTLLETPAISPKKGIERNVDICFDPDFGPDLKTVADQTGQSEDAVISAYLAETYQVVMYGFAPGYAYLSGVPKKLHLPRKPSAKRGVAAGSVIIAGSQSLITTLTMPTGWWIIGRSPTRILQTELAQPFLFEVGDHVRFNRIDRATFDTKTIEQ